VSNSVTINVLRHEQQQGRIFSSGGPGVFELWMSLSVTTNLGYDSFLFFLVLISYNNRKYKRIFHGCREANVSMKSVDSISIL
jgi:hypothetical protein